MFNPRCFTSCGYFNEMLQKFSLRANYIFLSTSSQVYEIDYPLTRIRAFKKYYSLKGQKNAIISWL